MLDQLRVLSLTFLLVLSFMEVICQENWRTFVSPTKTFSIECPGGLLQTAKQDIKTSIGTLTQYTHFIDMGNNDLNRVYSVSEISYPVGTFEPDSINLIEEFLMQMSESIEVTNGLTAQYKNFNANTAYPYILMRFQNDDTKTTTKTKVILHNDVVYTIQVFTPSQLSLNELIDHFMRSFKVLNR